MLFVSCFTSELQLASVAWYLDSVVFPDGPESPRLFQVGVFSSDGSGDVPWGVVVSLSIHLVVGLTWPAKIIIVCVGKCAWQKQTQYEHNHFQTIHEKHPSNSSFNFHFMFQIVRLISGLQLVSAPIGAMGHLVCIKDSGVPLSLLFSQFLCLGSFWPLFLGALASFFYSSQGRGNTLECITFLFMHNSEYDDYK